MIKLKDIIDMTKLQLRKHLGTKLTFDNVELAKYGV